MIEPNHRGLLRGCLALALLAAVLLVAFPTAAQSPDPVTLDIATSPDTSTLRQTEVEVKLTLQGNASVCPPITTQRSLDAVLLLDNSASMTGPSIDSAKAAAQLFVDSMSLDVPTNAGGDRVALITFSDQAVGLSDLTQDRNALQQLIQSIGPQSGTNIAAGIEAATIALTHNGKPANNPAQVIVLLSDGEDPDHPVAEAANQAKAKGVRIVTIRLGDRPIGDILRTIASVPTDYYEAPKPSDLADIYRRIADVIQPTTAAQNVNLNFRYDDYRFQLIPDSIKPAPTSVQGNVIHWDYPAIENVDAAVFSFRVVPLHTGDPVNVGEVVQSSYGYCEDTVARRPLSGFSPLIKVLWPVPPMPSTTALLTTLPKWTLPPANDTSLITRFNACINNPLQNLPLILGAILSLLGAGWVYWNWRRMQGCLCSGRCFIANSVLGLYTLFTVWLFALPLAAACGTPVTPADMLPLWPWLLPLLPLAMLAYLACHGPQTLPVRVTPEVPDMPEILPPVPVTHLPAPPVPEPLRLPALPPLWEPQPTLIVGLGKTGRWVLTYLKKTLLDANLNRPQEHISLLCLDTGDEKLLRQQDAPVEFAGVRLADDEIIELKDNLSWLLDDESIYNDPQFKGWITPEVLRQLQRTTNLDLSMGARQQRVLARLGFLLHLRQDKHNFFKRLLDVIPQCLTPEQRLNIVIVGDTMGDVSSATLFDVALLAREAGRKTNAKGTFITAHLVTDNATRAFSRNAEHDQANTGATLREIERYQLAEARPFPIYYPEIDSRRCNYLPLDNLLLYDGLSMEHLPPEQGVFADVADVITLWMDTAAHQGALKTLQDQQRSALLREQKNSGEVHCFSQGMFSYRLPAADLLEAVRAQFEQEIVRRLIMGHSNDPDFRVDPTLNRETFASGNTPAVLATAFLSGELSLVPRIPDSIFVALKAALDTSDDLPDRLSQLEDYEPDALAQRLGMLLSVLLNGAPETIRMDIFAARGGKIGFTLAFLKDLRVLIKKALHSLSAVSESNEARDTLIDSLKRLASVLTTSGNSLNAQIAALGMGTNDENTLLHRILADQVDLDERREQMAAVHSRRYLWEDGQGERLDKRWYSAYLEPQRHAALSQLFWQIDDAGTVCLTLVGSDQQGKQRVETRLDDLDTFHQALREMATRYCAPIHQSETLYAHLPGGPLSEDQIAQTAEHLRSASVVPLDFATVHAPQVQYQTILAADVDQVRTLETLIRPHVNEFTLLNSTDRFMLSLSQRAALVPFSAIKTLEPAREMYRVNHNLSNDPKIAAPVESILTAVYEAEQVALKLEADLNQKLRLRKDLLHPLVVTALADPQRTSAFVLALAAGEIETRKLRGEEKSTMWLSTPDAEKRIPVEIIADSQLQPLAQALLAFVLDNRAFDEPLVSAMLQRYCTDLRLGRQFRVWIKSDWQDVLDKLPTDNAENRKIGMDILKVSRLYADLYKQ